MQRIPYTNPDDVERSREEVARFNEHFQATFGQQYREHANQPEETTEEHHARIASYHIVDPTMMH